MCVVIRRWVWLEAIGVVSGCFPHITYVYIPTALVSALFCSSINNNNTINDNKKIFCLKSQL